MTDLQKFEGLLRELDILYTINNYKSYTICRCNKNGFGHEKEYKADIIALCIHESHLQYNFGASVEIMFDAADESFVAFEPW